LTACACFPTQVPPSEEEMLGIKKM